MEGNIWEDWWANVEI